MSFVVSFKGQFKPYILPDLNAPYYQSQKVSAVSPVFKNSGSKKVPEHEDRYSDLTSTDSHHNHIAKKKRPIERQGINTYEKVVIENKKAKIPHLARDLMTSPVHCHYHDEPLDIIKKTMDKFHYRHIPILNREQILVGIISDRDVLRAFHHDQRSDSILIQDIMTDEVLIAQTKTRIQDMAKIMLYENISALPIINHQDLLVGIVTLSDILEYIIHTLPLDTKA